jgi:hypothetical protein
MYARIKFHTYSKQKLVTVTVSRKQHKQNLQNLSKLYSSILETEAPTPQAINWGLRTPSNITIFNNFTPFSSEQQ